MASQLEVPLADHMNSFTAKSVSSTLHGATIQTAKGNEFINTGRDTIKIIQVIQNFIDSHTLAPESGQTSGGNIVEDSEQLQHVSVAPDSEQTSGRNIVEGNEDLQPVSDPVGNFGIYSAISTALATIFGRKRIEPAAIVSDILAHDNFSFSSLFGTTTERYTRSMLNRQCTPGYPLYEPRPDCGPSTEYRKKGIRVGDLGVVTVDGIFDFILNVCPSQNPLINPSELPDDFETLERPEIRVMEQHFKMETHLFNNAVNRIEETDIRYKCSGPEGAILELPAGATLFEAKNKFSFKALASRHAENWYKYTVVTRGRDVPNGSLYLVTSCIKCTDWGIAVFDRPSASQDYLQFVEHEFQTTNPNLHSKYDWKGSGSFIAKVAMDTNSRDDDSLNQCVFLRGYKIMLPKDVWDNAINPHPTGIPYLTTSSSSPNLGSKRETQGDFSNQNNYLRREDGGGSGSASGTSRRSAQNTYEFGIKPMEVDTLTTSSDMGAERVIIQADFSASPLHPSDIVNAALLSQEPDAKVALTHDDDWWDLLRDYEGPKKIASLYTSMIDEYGSTSLEIIGDRRGNDSISSTSATRRSSHKQKKTQGEDNASRKGTSTSATWSHKRKKSQDEYDCVVLETNVSEESPSTAGSGQPGISMRSGGGGGRAGQFGGGMRPHWHSGAANSQAEGRSTVFTSAGPAVVPVTTTTQLEGTQNVNMSDNPTLMNIGTSTGNLNTVNNHDGTHGLEDLKEFVSFAAIHSIEQVPDRCCHPGTRMVVLKRMRDWCDNRNATEPIAWLHGPAGIGKSVIAQTIANRDREHRVAATFFFSRSDPSRNDHGKRLFPTLAWQLARSIPATKDHIVHALDKNPHVLRKDVETQFEHLVAHPFHAMNHTATQMPQLVPTRIIIIDGIDECSDKYLRRMLTMLGNAVKNSRVPLRPLIISRTEALIKETLDQFKDFTLCIDLASLDDPNRDIEKYLADQFSTIASKHNLNPIWPGQQIIEEIVSKSSGNFIFPSTLMRHLSDEDHDPEAELDIILGLWPHVKMSPFALLDQLYLEILRPQQDLNFLRTYLALLMGRSSIGQDNLYEDDAILMNMSEEELRIKLRGMRSLFRLEPFIAVYHKSFLDFLQDSSRSGQYHVSKQEGQKRYLELIVASVVRHVSIVIEQPNHHETCRFSLQIKFTIEDYPSNLVLPLEYWQEIVKPLLDLQDKLLNTSKPKPCRVTQVMHDLLLHLVIMQGKSHHISTALLEREH